MKKFLIVFGVILLIVGGVLFVGNTVLENTLEKKLQDEISRTSGDLISFDNVSVNWFSNFPNVAVSLEGFAIKSELGNDDRSIYSMQKVIVVAEPIALLDGEVDLRNIEIVRPQFNVEVDNSGMSDWDILLEILQNTERISVNSDVDIDTDLLRNIQISNGSFTVVDNYSNITIVAEGIDWKVSGSEAEHTVLSSSLYVADVSLMVRGEEICKNMPMTMTANVDADFESDYFIITPETLSFYGFERPLSEWLSIAQTQGIPLPSMDVFEFWVGESLYKLNLPEVR